MCGWHTLVVVDNGLVDTGVCISPGGPNVPFSGFTPRNGSKENSFSSSLVVKNSPANTGDRISLFLDISRVYRRCTCYYISACFSLVNLIFWASLVAQW